MNATALPEIGPVEDLDQLATHLSYTTIWSRSDWINAMRCAAGLGDLTIGRLARNSWPTGPWLLITAAQMAAPSVPLRRFGITWPT